LQWINLTILNEDNYFSFNACCIWWIKNRRWFRNGFNKMELHRIVHICALWFGRYICTTLYVLVWIPNFIKRFHSIFPRLHNLKKINCEEVFEKIVDYIIKNRSESFCAKLKDWTPRRNTKRPSTLNDIIYYFIFKRVTKKNLKWTHLFCFAAGFEGSIKVSKVY
jgi:hypothetical protein